MARPRRHRRCVLRLTPTRECCCAAGTQARFRVKTQTGAARIVEALETANVRCVFGLPGTQTVELFEALRKSAVRTVVATNELAAAFMAGGWSRVTGEPGVLVTIPGPGFTWALTGIAEARLDSVPLLHITGAPAAAPIGKRFRQQEINQAAIAAPLVKGVIDADSYPDPAVAVLDGLLLARSGEPGPVLLQVSSTTLSREHTGAALQPAPVTAIRPAVLDAVCARVRDARRPILMVGQGANHYPERVRALVERLKAPLMTTPSARGVLPENHSLNFGFDSLAANIRDINELVQTSDLVLVIGCKLGHSGTGGFELKLPADRLVHVDASAEVLGANYPVSLGVVADAGDALEALQRSAPSPSAWSEEELEAWRNRLALRKKGASEPRIAGTLTGDAPGFFGALRRAMPADGVLVLDSGLHQILARRYYTVLSPCGLITPTDLQSMGFAIPTAIGARIAKPDRAVVALVGDGGFAMNGLELLSAVREEVALVVIVFVDGALGQIRMQQLANYGVSHGVSLESPDLGLLAASIGARHQLIGGDEAESAVRAALEYSGLTVLEVRVGDSFAIRRSAAVARAREMTRRVAGPRVVRLLKKLIRRLRQFESSSPRRISDRRDDSLPDGAASR
jgi:acetolactate synthase-1/2/3 large subunit